uniref:Uncharacterized protein n=1 Tax=Rhodnius prolixus TaxID=13249 RepID=T1I3I2_RHOPR
MIEEPDWGLPDKNTLECSAITGAKERHLLSRTCISPDLDPLDNCRPVDCHQKYNGEKPYFSRIRNKCIASPACYADPNKNMPDVAYLPLSNTCRDLENPITEEDVRYLTKVSEKSNASFSSGPHFVSWAELNMNLRCHHGKMNNQSGLCHCDEGWTSPPISDNMMISSTLLFHMCTIKKSTIRLFNFGYFANKFFEHGVSFAFTTQKRFLKNIMANDSKKKVFALSESLRTWTLHADTILDIVRVVLQLNLSNFLNIICFPSLDANYAISSSSDDEDYDAGKSFDSICSCLSGSEATDTTVATYYFMLDDVERELYMRGVNNAVYREVLEATICEFNRLVKV